MNKILAVLFLAAGGCAHAQTPDADATLEGLMRAAPRACTAEGATAPPASPGERVGVTETEIARTPLAGGGAVRTRRLELAPGGALPWHEHASRQGMAIVIAGELIETRNSCGEPLVYRPGDVARETQDLAHAWRNESGAPAVILAIDFVQD